MSAPLPIHPGLILRRDYMQPQEITEERLSHDLKVPLSTLQRILHENGKITGELGEKLDLYFNTPMGHWRKLQVEYEEFKPPRQKRERTKRQKVALGLKWTGLIIIFLPVFLFLLMLIMETQFNGSGSELALYLAMASLGSWVLSILIGLPMWASSVVASQHHVLLKIVEVVLVLGIYAACMDYTAPLTLIIIGGLGFSLGGT